MVAHSTLHLQRSFFSERERVVAEAHGITASLFRYDSGLKGCA